MLKMISFAECNCCFEAFFWKKSILVGNTDRYEKVEQICIFAKPLCWFETIGQIHHRQFFAFLLLASWLLSRFGGFSRWSAWRVYSFMYEAYRDIILCDEFRRTLKLVIFQILLAILLLVRIMQFLHRCWVSNLFCSIKSYEWVELMHHSHFRAPNYRFVFRCSEMNQEIAVQISRNEIRALIYGANTFDTLDSSSYLDTNDLRPIWLFTSHWML